MRNKSVYQTLLKVTSSGAVIYFLAFSIHTQAMGSPKPEDIGKILCTSSFRLRFSSRPNNPIYTYYGNPSFSQYDAEKSAMDRCYAEHHMYSDYCKIGSCWKIKSSN